DEEVLCGTIDVPENPRLPDGRRIALNVMVLPATGPDPAPEPVIPFFGGPGEGVVHAAAFIAEANRRVREVRDFVLVDIRGTGESNPLRCAYQDEHTYLERFMPLDGIARCAEELADRADLTRYTTSYIVDDVDRVREALGYERVIVTGGSYGTRATQVYMKRHPEHVAAAALHGVVPLDDRMPQTFARDAQRALDGVIDECAADDDCRRAFPRLRAELWTVLGRLEEGHTIPATVADPETGEEKRIELGRNSFLHGLRYMLYRVTSASQVPLAIHEAAADDASIVAAVADSYDRGLADAISEGLYLSVTCAEDVPWIEPEDAMEAAAGTFLGELRYRIQTAACTVWPRGEIPTDFFEPVRSEVPVLLASGALDPVTPPAQGAGVAKFLPNSLHLVVPSGAHDFGGLEGVECLKTIEEEFLRNASLEGLETGCVSEIRRAGFVLEGAAEEIELPSEALARFAGRYVSEAGFAFTITLSDDGVLRAEAAGQGTFRLAPVSETRFRVVGAPPGVALVFRVENGEAVGVTLEQGPGQTMELNRSEDGDGETGGGSGE
ncbi:MAG: alpha/beta fold hydrolase, partial [Acidobacteriota bacterium]